MSAGTTSGPREVKAEKEEEREHTGRSEDSMGKRASHHGHFTNELPCFSFCDRWMEECPKIQQLLNSSEIKLRPLRTCNFLFTMERQLTTTL